MELIMEMIEAGTDGPTDNTSTYDRAFSSDIERLEKDSVALIMKIKAAKKMLPPEDVIQYWNKMRYICMSRLPDFACDLLAAPASSVPSERMFSVSGLLSSGKNIKLTFKMIFIFFKF